MKLLPDDTIRVRWRVGDTSRTFVGYNLPEGKTLEVFDDEALPCNVVRLREIHIATNGRTFALELQGVPRALEGAQRAEPHPISAPISLTDLRRMFPNAEIEPMASTLERLDEAYKASDAPIGTEIEIAIGVFFR